MACRTRCRVASLTRFGTVQDVGHGAHRDSRPCGDVLDPGRVSPHPLCILVLERIQAVIDSGVYVSAGGQGSGDRGRGGRGPCGSRTRIGCTSRRPERRSWISSTTTWRSGRESSNAAERPCMMPLPDRGERREGPPEAGARRCTAVAGHRPCPLPPLRAARRRALCDRAGARHLGGADVDRGVPSVELSARRRGEARRMEDRPRSDATLHAGDGPAGRTSSTRCSTSSARSVGRRRPVVADCTCTCASSRGSGSGKCAPAALAFA